MRLSLLSPLYTAAGCGTSSSRLALFEYIGITSIDAGNAGG
jgi:hypothetical protein